MPARIPCRGLLVLSPYLALLQGCAAVFGSNSTDRARLDAAPNIGAVESKKSPAANARVRSGFHYSLGLGAGRADITCDGCVFDSRTGFSGFLSLARAVRQKTLLGVEATGWTKERSGTTVRVYSLMAHLTEYLNRTSGLFLRTGIGLIGFDQDGDFQDLSADGLGFSGRLGYELGTGGVVVVPYVGYVRGLGGAGVRNTDSEVVISNFQFGLGIAAP